MKVGSLFSGIGGLDLAVCDHFGAEVAWFSEIDKGPREVLARHYPDVPNLGDITAIDWSEVESVDILCGGFPCQDISYAGLGAGIRPDTRSGLWLYFAQAIRHLRPRYAVVENVSALLARGMGIVLGDLAEAGYDARWTSVRASDIGAPHRRERIFVLAHAAGDEGRGIDGEPERPATHSLGEPVRNRPRDVGVPPSSSESREKERQRIRPDDLDGGPDATPDAESVDGPRPLGGGNRSGRSEAQAGNFDWRHFTSAIRRWERVMGPAPIPIDDRRRLAAPFVEWMMGFPPGHVSGLTRTQALKALGNAVLPQQAALALSILDGAA